MNEALAFVLAVFIVIGGIAAVSITGIQASRHRGDNVNHSSITCIENGGHWNPVNVDDDIKYECDPVK